MLLALLALPLASVAYADEELERNQTDERLHREVDIFRSPDGTMIVIRSEVENGTVENHFGLLVATQRERDDHVRDGLVIHVAFSHETEVGDVENEAFLYMRIAYLALTEFVDANGNGALDTGVDNVIRQFPLNTTYAPLEYATIVSDDGKQGWQIVARTAFVDGGTFEVTAEMFPQYAVVDGTIVPPTATKITTVINNFPFTNPGDPNDRVALRVLAISKTVIEHETPTTEEKIRVRSATAEGFFTWAPTAQVDGVTVNVESSLTRLERPRWIINLAYPQGSTIVHDPILGFSFGSTPILTSRLLIGAAIAATAMFGVLVYLGRRQLAGVFTPKPVSQ